MSNDTRSDYYAYVQNMAQELWDSALEVFTCESFPGEDIEWPDASDVRCTVDAQALSERVDGSYWVIYTHAARACLMYSDNDELYFEEYGPIEVASWASLFCAAAYMALMADVQEELTNLENNHPDENPATHEQGASA